MARINKVEISCISCQMPLNFRQMAKQAKQTSPNNEKRRSAKGLKRVAGSALSNLSRDARNGAFTIRKERISKLGKSGFSSSELHKLVAPPRTLARRETTLSLEESDRVQRLERTMEHATRVFGSLEKANIWLRKPNKALNNARPIELLISETGAHEIEMQLHAIDHGMYA